VSFNGHSYTVSINWHGNGNNFSDVLVAADNGSPVQIQGVKAFGSSPPFGPQGTVEAKAGTPSLAAFNGQLYLAWTDTDTSTNPGHVNVAALALKPSGVPTGGITDLQTLNQDSSDSQPALGVFDDALVLAYGGPDGEAQDNVGTPANPVHLDFSNASSPLSFNHAVTTGAFSYDQGPQLFVFDNQLYLLHLVDRPGSGIFENIYNTINLNTAQVFVSNDTLYINGPGSTPINNAQITLEDDLPPKPGFMVVINGNAVADQVFPPFKYVNINGDSNTVTVDYGNGNPFPKGVSFDAGTGTNTLVLKTDQFSNFNFTKEVETPASATGGTLVFDGTTSLYSNVSTIDDNVPVITAIYNATGAAEPINIVDVTGKNVFGTEINSGAAKTFATIDLDKKINVTVNGVAGPDTVTLDNPHPDTLDPSFPLKTLTLDLATTPAVNFLGVPPDTKDPNTVDLQDLPPGLSSITVTGAGTTTLAAHTGLADVWHNTGTGKDGTAGGTLDVGAAVGAVNFSEITNETGGGTDTFKFEGGTVPGNIDGGKGGSSSLDYSALAGPVTVHLVSGKADDIGGTFTNIKNVVGSMSPNDKLLNDAVWDISGPDSGSVNGITFSSFEDLVGGSGADQFVFLPGGSIGSIDGDGGTNTLDYSALAGPVSVNLQTGKATDIAGTFSNISNFIGSQSDSDSFTASNGDATWTLADAGVQYASNGQTGSFSSFEQYHAGTGTNLFQVVGALTHPLSIHGGSSKDVLQGPDLDDTWQITGADSGTMDGNLTYADIPNLEGGSGSDSFVFAGGSVSGNLDGDGGTNTLDYQAVPVSGPIDLGRGVAPLIAGLVKNIERVLLLQYHSPPTAAALTVPTVTLSAALVAGQELALAVRVSSIDDPATGVVVFLDEYRGHLQLLGVTALDANGSTTLPVRLAAGGHLLLALYLGDATHAGSVSTPQSLVVPAHKQPPGGAAARLPVTLTTLLDGRLGAATGDVLFLDVQGGLVHFLGVAAVDGSGRATLAAALSPGKHELIAVYMGDGTYGAAVSAPAAFRSGSEPMLSLITLPGVRTPLGPGAVGTIALGVGPGGAGPQFVHVQVNSSLGTAQGPVLVLDVTPGGLRLLGIAHLDAVGGAVLPDPLGPGRHLLFAFYLADDRSGNRVSALVPAG
jgi:hypothetical protein